jgi:ABC-type antimicrobial peptide transport system permease subunit
VARFHEEVVRRAQSVPGVTLASTINYLPLNHETQTAQFSVTGGVDVDVAGGRRPEAVALTVGPGYFDVLRIPLLEGRVVDSSDRRGQTDVAVVNRTMAERYWPGRSAVGATLQVGESDTPTTVVGVVADTRHDDLAASPGNQMYLVQAQRPWTYLRLLARSTGDVAAQAGPLSAAIRDVDQRLPIGEIRTMREVVDQFLLPQRSLSAALLALGGFALWLALFGIYSIVSCFVADRTRELGVRVALGADESRIVRHVLRRGLVPAVWALVSARLTRLPRRGTCCRESAG